MAGFVYVMSNPSYTDGMIKIGMSQRDPRIHRKGELETTGVPLPFNVEYFAFVDEPLFIERAVHNDLSNYRVNKSREFFTCSIPEAINSIKKNAGMTLKYEEINYTSPEKIELQAKKKQELLEQQRIAQIDHENSTMRTEFHTVMRGRFDVEANKLHSRSQGYLLLHAKTVGGVIWGLFNGSANIVYAFSEHIMGMNERRDKALDEFDKLWEAELESEISEFFSKVSGPNLNKADIRLYRSTITRLTLYAEATCESLYKKHNLKKNWERSSW